MTDIQEEVVVSGSSIKGKLKYLDSGDIVTEQGAGYYLALDLTDNDFAELTSVKVGMNPSAGTPMTELVGASDKNGLFKVSNKFNQKFVIIQTNGTDTKTQSYDLSQLELVKG